MNYNNTNIKKNQFIILDDGTDKVEDVIPKEII